MPAAVRPQDENHNRQFATATIPSGVPQRKGRKSRPLTVIESISRPEPAWLPWVLTLRKATTPITLISLSGVLLVYGLNVVMQREWGTQFNRLNDLQHQHNALTTQVERLKYQIPRQLEVSPKNFVDLNQENTIFIQPEDARPFKSTDQAQRRSLLRDDRVPVGY